MAGYYEIQLIVLITFVIIALALDRYASTPKTAGLPDDSAESPSASGRSQQVATLTRQYLTVFGIVMGADWLQGPYVYALYNDQYEFEERIVAILFVTGFISAGIAAPFVGVWADTHGRKRLCLAFCVMYTISCALIQIPYLPILFVGRILAGISTAILYSAFETWVVSASSAFPKSDLSSILGSATLLNGFVAAGAGVASNQLVESDWGSFSTPFVASGVLLCLGFVVISATWTENYGLVDSAGTKDKLQVRRIWHAINIVREDPILLVLGLTQCIFEGSMYIFVFVWTPLLTEAAVDKLPLGYIFSSFMVSMMLGSQIYGAICRFTPSSGADSSLTLHAKLSSLVCAVSSVAFAVSISYSGEHDRFWAFCAFEACVGLYFPVQGMLRSSFIANEHRATLSSLFRVPLNIFVVVSLVTGVSKARDNVMTFCAAMLAISSITTALVVVRKTGEADTQRSSVLE